MALDRGLVVYVLWCQSFRYNCHICTLACSLFCVDIDFMQPWLQVIQEVVKTLSETLDVAGACLFADQAFEATCQ